MTTFKRCASHAVLLLGVSACASASPEPTVAPRCFIQVPFAGRADSAYAVNEALHIFADSTSRVSFQVTRFTELAEGFVVRVEPVGPGLRFGGAGVAWVTRHGYAVVIDVDQ